MKRFFLGLCLTFFSCSLLASEVLFQVSDIRIEGLQRVSAGTVFSALPINVGDKLDQASVREASRSIFSTGFFADVAMAQENGVLVIVLTERPAISEINLEVTAIQSEQLLDALTDNGLSEGQIFRQSILEGMAKSFSDNMSLKVAMVLL